MSNESDGITCPYCKTEQGEETRSSGVGFQRIYRREQKVPDKGPGT